MKLVTDGKSWAIRRGFWVFKQWFCFSNCYWRSEYLEKCWTDNKKLAETWLWRLK